MIDLSKPNEWQRIDPELGLVQPWYTFPALDEIANWNLRDAYVYEYGIGASTIWWAHRCIEVCGVENNKEYFAQVWDDVTFLNAYLTWESDKEKFISNIYYYEQGYDIVIIDCEPVEWRDECVEHALNCLRPGGKLIIDNWYQLSVWTPNEHTQTLTNRFPHKIFKQPGHPDWQTAIFYKPL